MTGVFSPPPTVNPTPSTPPHIYATHIHPKLPNMEDNDRDQAGSVDQAFDLDYGVAQAFYPHTVPKAVLLFTGEALNDGM